MDFHSSGEEAKDLKEETAGCLTLPQKEEAKIPLGACLDVQEKPQESESPEIQPCLLIWT